MSESAVQSNSPEIASTVPSKTNAIFPLLFSGLVLGVGWAIRGVFGHEWGAAWAGSMGCLAVIVAANRDDWLRRAPLLASVGAVGWGLGGMMSYGLVIGYCRGVDFGNVFYGYTMLSIIGGLYGFVGGGLFGLGLESGGEKKAAWHSLIVEMFVVGFLVYVVLVDFMELRMTPPRSDNWARCLGAAIALAWFLHRGGFHRALRVAAYGGLGGGFGFAFGNLIQTLGTVIGIPINMWNVMEFTLGFCGGVGMAYAVLSRDWPESGTPSKSLNWLGIGFFAVLLPLANRLAAMKTEHFAPTAERLGIADVQGFVDSQLSTATLTWLAFSTMVVLFWWWSQRRDGFSLKVGIPILLAIHSIHYASLGAIKTSILYTPFELTNTRLWYFPILFMIACLWIVFGRREISFPALSPVRETEKRWMTILIGLLALFAVFALISISSHNEPLNNAQVRF
ncbi:MAG: hypothetical protein H6751_07110 [Candidatus Omnitrophica bacterium]|nr:hypothetical protein [Candidatus Omnitrophota bacterium]